MAEVVSIDHVGLEKAPSGSASGAVGRRFTPMLVFLATLAATLYPPLVSYRGQGLGAAFKFFAWDTFYYLAVAEHSVGKPFFTFDGELATNGFHPLWQGVLRASFSVLGWQGAQPVQLAFTFGLSAVLVAAGAALVALAVLRRTGRPVLAVLSVVPGGYYLLFAAVDPHYGATWSFVNGMESGLTILFGGVLVYLLVGRGMWRRRTLVNVATVSFLATLLVLSRLDDVFVFLPLLLAIGLYPQEGERRVPHLLVAAAIPTLLIGAYLLYNLMTVGLLLPVSGMLKAQGGLALSENLAALLGTLSPPADSSWAGASIRLLQMIVPLVASGLWLAYRSFRPRGEEARGAITGEAALSLFAVYVLAKGLYNLVNVRLWDQGHWYYPLSILVTNLILALFLHRALRGKAFAWRGRFILDRERLRLHTRLLLLAAGVAGLTVGVVYLFGESQQPVFLGRYSVKRLLVIGGAFASGAVLVGPARALALWATERLRPRSEYAADLRFMIPIVAALFVLVAANAFVALKLGDVYGAEQGYQFWQDREAVAARLQAAGGPGGIIELDDGIISYALPNKTMSGFGLTLDAEAFAAWQRGALLDLAYDRGYRFIGSMWYAQYWPDETFTDPAVLRERMASALWGQRTEGWDFEPVYVERGRSYPAAFIRFSPRSSP